MHIAYFPYFQEIQEMQMYCIGLLEMGASCRPCLRINEDTIQYNTIRAYK